MKKLSVYGALIIISISFIGCDKENTPLSTDENGLTKNITDLVPQDIIDQMDSLGMPIYGGANPPILEGTYLGSPFVLVSSNRFGDTPGFLFQNYKVTFSKQKNDDLTIMVDYDNGVEIGNGIGSFIVGEDDNFSVFVEVNSTHTGGTSARLIHVVTGKLGDNGIEDMYFANFMIDNFGNPQGVWIENGEGRVVFDEDGFSELL